MWRRVLKSVFLKFWKAKVCTKDRTCKIRWDCLEKKKVSIERAKRSRKVFPF